MTENKEEKMQIGQIVHYTPSEVDRQLVNRRRLAAHAAASADEMTGAIVMHRGNHLPEGAVFPLVITRVVGNLVNGQVMLDGEDTLWVTERSRGFGPGQWHTFAWETVDA